MNAAQLLEVLRDARELGDKAFEQSVLEQLDLDVAYVKMTSRRGTHRGWQRDRTWLEWTGPLQNSRLSSLAALYMRLYGRPDHMERLAQSPPSYASLTKFEKIKQLNDDLLQRRLLFLSSTIPRLPRWPDGDS